eukprot:GHVU01138999.1.p1 GENE.GHVU01138999.1~~GHVU01138999.1.p1  ORF type:complete len:110 (-),score=2.03 GHVU01138999.1:1136-1465(-)
MTEFTHGAVTSRQVDITGCQPAGDEDTGHESNRLSYHVDIRSVVGRNTGSFGKPLVHGRGNPCRSVVTSKTAREPNPVTIEIHSLTNYLLLAHNSMCDTYTIWVHLLCT